MCNDCTTLRNRVVDLSEQGDTLTRLLAAVAAELPPLVEGDTPEGLPLAEHVRRLRERAYRAEGDAETLREQLAERDAAANVYRGIADALREQLAAVQQHADELRQYALMMDAHDGRVVSAGADAILAAMSSPSTQEPQTVCEWRPMSGAYYLGSACHEGEYGDVFHIYEVRRFKACPYCTLPLTLSPESPK